MNERPHPFPRGRIHLAGAVPGYAQGGMVVDGIAYFAAGNRHLRCAEGYPNVVAFDVRTLRVRRTYAFNLLGDSTPLVVARKNGSRIIVGHENRLARTMAFDLETGAPAWTSAPNQPGSSFFGYAYVRTERDEVLLLARSDQGLHALSAADGREAWHVKRRGGMTPAVDQAAGRIFFQSWGRMDKIEAASGRVLKSVPVPADPRGGEQAGCNSGNTVLADDRHGYHVATCWNNGRLFSSTVKVFDRDLKLVWQTPFRLMSKKATLCYHDGRLFTGCGDSWSVRDYQRLPSNDWKRVSAFAIATGRILWECDLAGYPILDIQGVVYCRGMLIAQTTWLGPYHIFLIDAADGRLLDVYHGLGRWASSCAQPLFTAGRLFNGDLNSNCVLAVQIGRGKAADWPGAFGDAQRHPMAAPDEALETLDLRPPAARRGPSYQEVLREAGALYRAKDYAAARAQTLEAYRLGVQQAAPGSFLRQCALRLGHAFFRDGMLADAAQVYETLLQIEDASAAVRGTARLTLGHIRRRTGDPQAARAHYREVQTMPGIHPKWLWAAAEAGHMHGRQHDYERARSAYSKVVKMVCPAPENIRKRAHAAEQSLPPAAETSQDASPRQR